MKTISGGGELLLSNQYQNIKSNSSLEQAVSLSKLSPRDGKFDRRRAQSEQVRNLYQGTVFDRYAGRIDGCAGRLEFAWVVDEAGQPKLKLVTAFFCKVRHCPMCAFRRGYIWRGKVSKILPKIVQEYPTHRFVFLTLSVKNCPVTELKQTLQQMNKAWSKLTKRSQFPAVGFVRTTELTRKEEGLVHPHFHCFLMVEPGYFAGKNYLSQAKWTQLWQESLKINYTPIVDVRAVKPRKGTQAKDMFGAVLETFKYTIKPSDIIGSNNEPELNEEWLVELTAQMHGVRIIATGGLLKEYLKELEEDPQDLIHVNDTTESLDDAPRLYFDWETKVKKYLLNDD